MQNDSLSHADRRGRVVAIVAGGHADAAWEESRFERVVPIYSAMEAFVQATPVPMAWIHWKHPIVTEAPEFYLEVTVEGAPALVPCRRANRVDDPHGIYFVDGQPWCSLSPELAGHVQAKLVGADIRQSSPEMLDRLLPQLAPLNSRSM